MANEHRLTDYPAKGFETITVSSTAIGITSSLLTNARAAFLTIEDANIRYRIDGTAPTASVGHKVVQGGTIWLADKTKANLSNLRMIRTDSTDAKAQVTIY